MNQKPNHNQKFCFSVLVLRGGRSPCPCRVVRVLSSIQQPLFRFCRIARLCRSALFKAYASSLSLSLSHTKTLSSFLFPLSCSAYNTRVHTIHRTHPLPHAPTLIQYTTSQHAPTPDLAYITRTSVRYEYDDDYMTRHDWTACTHCTLLTRHHPRTCSCADSRETTYLYAREKYTAALAYILATSDLLHPTLCSALLCSAVPPWRSAAQQYPCTNTNHRRSRRI